MIEILPIKILTDEDAVLFGSLNVLLGKLARIGFPVASGIVITPPQLKLKTCLEHYDFGKKEVFEQTLTLVKKEISATPIPEVLLKEVGKHQHFFLQGVVVKSVKNLWLILLNSWLEQIKNRLWSNGFSLGITNDLSPQIVTFTNKPTAYGLSFFDSLQDDVVINSKLGKLEPKNLKKVADLVQAANKRLFIPYEYEWILDKEIKLVGIKPCISASVSPAVSPTITLVSQKNESQKQSAVKVFFDLSNNLTIEKEIEGVYISAEKIFDLNKPHDSFENLVFRLVESAMAFPKHPVLFKLADLSEGMGKIRGALRLLHQKSLFTPMVEAVSFARHKKGLTNVHLVIPFVRSAKELAQIKTELAAKKLMRKASLGIWLEACTPENIINLENYLAVGVDGVVLNLDELVAYLNGFDVLQADLLFYKNEVDGLIKFLSEAVKLMHKVKIPFIAYGSLNLYPKVLEFLVEAGIYAIVVEKYWAHSAHDLLYQTEKRLILRKS